MMIADWRSRYMRGPRPTTRFAGLSPGVAVGPRPTLGRRGAAPPHRGSSFYMFGKKWQYISPARIFVAQTACTVSVMYHPVPGQNGKVVSHGLERIYNLCSEG